MHKKRRVVLSSSLLLVLISLLSLSMSASAANAGELDPAFGTGGLVIVDFGDIGDYARDMVIDGDGKILVVGTSFTGAANDFALLRLNTDGSLDTTFDTDGKLTTDFGGNDEAFAVALDSLGRIIVAGETDVDGDKDVAVARYNPDGSLDTTFDTDGLMHIDSLALNLVDYARGVTVDASDKIVIAGYAAKGVQGEDGAVVIRFDTDGVVDPTFGVRQGTPEVNSEAYSVGTDVKIDAAGRVLITLALRRSARYTTGGEFDTTFGGNGVATFNTAFNLYMEGLVAAPGGKVLASGSSHFIARLNSDGSDDTSFSADGAFTGFNLDGADSALDVAIDSQARIITAGYYTPGTNNTDIAVTRIDTVGNIDTTFGNNGVATFALSTSLDSGEAVAIDDQDRILVAGYMTGTAGNVDMVVMRLAAEDELPTDVPTEMPTEVPTEVPATELLTGGDMETDTDGDKLPDGWKGKNTGVDRKDKLKCNVEGSDPIAHSGECAFMFKGNPNGTVGKLQFKLADTSGITNGATLTYSAWLDPRSAPVGLKFGQAKVKYSDGTNTKINLNVPDSAGYSQQSNSAVIDLTGRTIVNVKADLRYAATSGKYFVDDASLTVATGDARIALPGQ